MRTRLWHLGYNAGWKLGQKYATGTRQQRAAIRVKLQRLSESYSQFAQGIHQGVNDLCEQRAESIKLGLAPRTCNPHKLERVLSRVA